MKLSLLHMSKQTLYYVPWRKSYILKLFYGIGSVVGVDTVKSIK